ncbi:MAG: hypothetical protein N2171_07835 [Clostridia bacterium]|nr:hypothetical protein [Clostridia bacterium]
MVSETIKRIKDAELSAEAAQQDAERESALIIENAHKNAEQIITNAVSSAKKQAEVIISEAKNKAQLFHDDALEQMSAEIEKIERLASDKRDDAVKMIVSEII